MTAVTEAVAKTAIALYQELANTAKQEDLEDKGTFTVFRGSLLTAFENVSSTRSYYTKCYNVLKAADCISVLNRGARSIGSVVVLHSPPTLERLLEVDPALLTEDRARATLYLEAQMRDLIASFRGLNPIETFANFEDRIARLESQVRLILKQGENNNVADS